MSGSTIRTGYGSFACGSIFAPPPNRPATQSLPRFLLLRVPADREQVPPRAQQAVADARLRRVIVFALALQLGVLVFAVAPAGVRPPPIIAALVELPSPFPLPPPAPARGR